MKKSLIVLALMSSYAVAGENKAFIGITGEYENIHGSTNDSRAFHLTPGVKLNNGFTIDLKTQMSSKENDHVTSSLIEPRVKYDYKIGMTDFTVWGRLGLGERFESTGNFGYYTVEPGVTYSLTRDIKLFVSDRYRDSISNGKNYQTNTIFVGANKNLTDDDVLGLKLYRKYNDTESNGVELEYTHWF